jgi:hypothetical protein
MKYCCKNCGSAIELGPEIIWSDDRYCPICECFTLIEFPGYETPEQYEKRTGKEFPNEGAVWFRPQNGSADFVWGICRYITAKKCGDKDVVIADPPVPPPDGWRPEEANNE